VLGDPFCMIGGCFGSIAAVDGLLNLQPGMTPVRDGLRIRRQDGAGSIRLV
jgi:D-hydroxyproline dehydrogenase subunit gamma